MNKPQIGIYDAETNEWEYRDMTDEEIEQSLQLPDFSATANQTTVLEGDTMPHLVWE